MSLFGKIMIPLENWIRTQQFQPRRSGILVNPVYTLRRSLYKEIYKISVGLSGKILDYGCGNSPYRSMFSNSEYFGIDIEMKNEDDHLMKFDGSKIPFEDQTFDVVLCSEVIEHVTDDSLMINEVKRVLKPKGILLLTVPFFWEEHGHPYDYRRFTEQGIITILQNQGFKIKSSKKTTRATGSILQLLSSRLYNRMHLKNFYLNVLMILVFIAPINIASVIISKIFPGSSKIYLNTVILAQNHD